MARQVGPPVLLLGRDDVTLWVTGDIQLMLPADTRVSLFPLAEVTGRSTGLRWPIEGADAGTSGSDKHLEPGDWACDTRHRCARLRGHSTQERVQIGSDGDTRLSLCSRATM